MSFEDATNRNVSDFVNDTTQRKWNASAIQPFPERNTADEGLVSDEMRDAIFAVYTWMMPLSSALSILFCVVNAAVYSQQRAATFALYLIGVDIGDGLCAVVKLCSNVAYFTLSPRAFQRLLIDWYMGKYLALSFRRAAICLNLLASLERFLAIAFPLKNISRRVLGRSLAIIVGVFLVCLTTHSFLAFEYHVIMKGDGGWKLAPTEWKMANPNVFVVVGTVVSCVFAYAPLTVILVLNFLLLVMLRAHASSLKTVRKARGTKSEDRASRSFLQGETVPEMSTQHRFSPQSNHEGRNSETRENSDIREINNTQTGHRSFSDSIPGAQFSDKNPLQHVGIKDTSPSTTNHGHHHHQSAASNSTKQHPGSKYQRNDSPSTTNHTHTHHHPGVALDSTKQHPGSEHQRQTLPMQSSKKTSSGKRTDGTDASVTRMVMVFTTVFFLLALPDMLSFSARVLLPEYGPEGREANLFQTVSLIARLASHLTEPALFWVSFAYSRHFRRAVFRLPGAKWCCGRCLAVTPFTSTSSLSCDVSSRSSKGTH